MTEIQQLINQSEEYHKVDEMIDFLRECAYEEIANGSLPNIAVVCSYIGSGHLQILNVNDASQALQRGRHWHPELFDGGQPSLIDGRYHPAPGIQKGDDPIPGFPRKLFEDQAKKDRDS